MSARLATRVESIAKSVNHDLNPTFLTSRANRRSLRKLSNAGSSLSRNMDQARSVYADSSSANAASLFPRPAWITARE